MYILLSHPIYVSKDKKLKLFDYIPITFYYDMRNENFEDDFKKFLKIFNHFDQNSPKANLKIDDLDLGFLPKRRVGSLN